MFFLRMNKFEQELLPTLEQKKCAEILERLADTSLREMYHDRERFARERVETKQRFFAFLEESFGADHASTKKFRSIFDGAEGENDLELLTLIRLYGSSCNSGQYKEELFRHSLGVFRIGAEVFSDVLTMEASGGKSFFDINGRIQVEMNEKSAENAELNFLRACLIHDCGKTTIPEVIMYNSVSDEMSRNELLKSVREGGSERLSLRDVDAVFARLAKANVGTFPSIEIGRNETGAVMISPEDREKVCEWLNLEKNAGVRVNPHMPVVVLFEMNLDGQEIGSDKSSSVDGEGAKTQREPLASGEDTKTQRNSHQEYLKSIGINPDDPLGAVIDHHESRSGILVNILDRSALLKKSIVENHHNKDDSRYHSYASGNVNGYKDEEPFLNVTLWLVRMIDELEARCAKRSYKPSMLFENALSLIVDESGNVSVELKKVSAYFINNRIKNHYGVSSSQDGQKRWMSDANLNIETRKYVQDFLVQEGVWSVSESS